MSTHVNWTMFEVVASTSFYVLTVYDSIFFWKIIIENPDMIEPHMHAETIAKNFEREKKNFIPFLAAFIYFCLVTVVTMRQITLSMKFIFYCDVTFWWKLWKYCCDVEASEKWKLLLGKFIRFKVGRKQLGPKAVKKGCGLGHLTFTSETFWKENNKEEFSPL